MTYDQLLAKIDDESAWIPDLIKALRAVVELPIEINTTGMIMAHQTDWDTEKIAGFFYVQGYATAMHTVIQAIEKELG